MTTYYVSSLIGNNRNGGTSASAPLATLQSAAGLVRPGDTVEVMNGTYTGPAYGDVLDITISGTAGASITFEAAPGQTPVIDSSGAWNGINIQASYIIIDGFTVVGDAANYTLTQALAGFSTGNANLDGNGITIDSPGGGVNPNHITIENNIVYNEPGGGITANNADYVQFLNNVVHDNAHWSAYGNSGISIGAAVNSDTNPGPHDTVLGNISYNNTELVPEYRAGQITDGEGIILDTNPGYTGGFLVQGNATHGNSGPGIEVFLTKNVVVTGNTTYGDLTNPQLANRGEISVISSSNVSVTNNTTIAPALSGAMVLSVATERVALPASTQVATFIDPSTSDLASGFTALIDWGDGTAATSGTVSGSAGSFTVSSGHTYADEGSDPVSVTLTRTSDGASIALTGTVLVGENDALSGTGKSFSVTANQLFSGVVGSFSDTDLVTPASDLAATINWGDGTAAAAGTVSGSAGSFTVSGTHTYTTTGTDAVTVMLSDDAPGTATATATGTATVAAPTNPPPVSVGTGPDQLILSIAEDAYANGDGTSDAAGDAQFTVTVDGQQIGGTLTALASHAAGGTQDFLVEGTFGPGSHTATINFINDAYGGTPSTDRNLYVTGATIDGQAIPGTTLNLFSNGPQSFGFQGRGTTGTMAPAVVVGSGPDTLDLKVNEDAWGGDALFTVSVDGQQIGATLTALASHAADITQDFLVQGNFGPGSHTATINFINDAYGGTPSTDRNLYVAGATIDGQAISGSTLNLYSNGPQSFGFQGPTNLA